MEDMVNESLASLSYQKTFWSHSHIQTSIYLSETVSSVSEVRFQIFRMTEHLMCLMFKLPQLTSLLFHILFPANATAKYQRRVATDCTYHSGSLDKLNRPGWRLIARSHTMPSDTSPSAQDIRQYNNLPKSHSLMTWVSGLRSRFWGLTSRWQMPREWM